MRVPLFTGRFEGLTGDPADAGHAITASLQLFDFMGDWAAYDPLETTDTGNQRTNLRVQAALDRYGWPADERDIQVGDHRVTGSTLSDTTLEECQRAADAEGGAFFCLKDGLAVFKSKDWLTTDTRSTVIQGYVGYTEVPAVYPTPIYGPAETVLTGTPELNVADPTIGPHLRIVSRWAGDRHPGLQESCFYRSEHDRFSMVPVRSSPQYCYPGDCRHRMTDRPTGPTSGYHRRNGLHGLIFSGFVLCPIRDICASPIRRASHPPRLLFRFHSRY